MSSALSLAEQALLSGDEDRLYDALRTQALGLHGLQSQNKGWYLKQLMADRENKDQVGRAESLTTDTVKELSHSSDHRHCQVKGHVSFKPANFSFLRPLQETP